MGLAASLLMADRNLSINHKPAEREGSPNLKGTSGKIGGLTSWTGRVKRHNGTMQTHIETHAQTQRKQRTPMNKRYAVVDRGGELAWIRVECGVLDKVDWVELELIRVAIAGIEQSRNWSVGVCGICG